MKWISTFSGELNNAATYFFPFANVNQTNKNTIGGSIGGNHATWQPWSYNERLKIVKKVEDFKKSLQDPRVKQRSTVTKFISQNKSRQEFPPPLGKYIDIIKPEPLHNTDNAWQQWFLAILSVAIQNTPFNQLNPATVLSELPSSCVLIKFCKCVKESLKCVRLFNSFA